MPVLTVVRAKNGFIVQEDSRGESPGPMLVAATPAALAEIVRFWGEQLEGEYRPAKFTGPYDVPCDRN
jgi:hypothetical protein